MRGSPKSTGEIILYQTEDGQTRVECRFADENIWLSQALMAELFQTTVPNINLHIKNILAEGVFEGGAFRQGVGAVGEGGEQVKAKRPGFALFVALGIGESGEIAQGLFERGHGVVED